MSTRFQEGVSGVATRGPIIVASIALNVLALLMPLAILMLFDRVIPFQSTGTLTMLALILIGAQVFEFVLRWTRSVLLSTAAGRAAIHNQNVFMSYTLDARPRDYAAEAPAIKLERYSAIGRMRDYVSGQNQMLSIDLPFTFVFIAMVGLIGGGLVIVPLFTLCGVLVFAAILKRKQRSIFDQRKSLDARRYAFLSEVLGNMAVVKANTMERQMTRRFELLREQTVDMSHKLIIFSGFAQNYGAVFAQLSTAGMGLVGAYFVINDAIGIAELAACMLLNGRITQPLMKLMSLWVQSENVAASKEKLKEIEATPCISSAVPNVSPMRGQIEFVDVSLGLETDDKPIAVGLNRKVTRGEIVLVESEDPRAFSALVDALDGRRPLSGKVMIDGYLAQDRRAQRGRGGLAILEADPAIFSGSLLDNLCGFGRASQVARAKHFAEALGLEERIHRLPMGYDTEMNTGSLFEKDPVNRQLISLVRILALDPKIIVMREPTAVLENKERDALLSCLTRLFPRPTLLVWSPDPRFQRAADQVITLSAHPSDSVDAWLEDQASDEANARRLKETAA